MVADADLLRAALDQYGLLILRDLQTTEPSDLVEIASLFGSPEIPFDQSQAHRDYPFVHAIRGDGVSAGRRSSSHFWHTDRSFLNVPSRVTVLRMVHAPLRGGETLFLDSVSAFEQLISAEPGLLLDQLVALHSYARYFEVLEKSFYSAEEKTNAVRRFPEVTHPLVAQATGGKKALYYSDLCVNVIVEPGGVDVAPNIRRLLTRIRPLHYRHKWRIGD
ncbi:MAG: TauD/TfdA dioxygenase family protein, partial [Acidimicrobiales bacterium]